MDIRILKLSNEKRSNELISSKDILAMHLGYFEINGKVAYSTDIPIANKPDYILLTLGNIKDICYLCHVEKYDYKGKGIYFSPNETIFKDNVPDKFKDDKNISWLLLDSMQKIPIDFLDAINREGEVINFINDRANHKILY